MFSREVVLIGGAVGMGVAIGYTLAASRFSRQKEHKSIDQETPGDDNYNSLFYSIETETDGRGMPTTGTIDSTSLLHVHRDYQFLPKELYTCAVENLVIACVDVIAQRKSDKKILLFYRRDAPAKNIWWFPGGRMFRGEAFDVTARRKVRDETGGKYSATPKGLVSVWNTFFPDSAWDSDRQPGKEGTQTINAVVVCECDCETIDPREVEEGGAVSAWAVEAQRWISVDDALLPGNFDKYVRLNIARACARGLLDR